MPSTKDHANRDLTLSYSIPTGMSYSYRKFRYSLPAYNHVHSAYRSIICKTKKCFWNRRPRTACSRLTPGCVSSNRYCSGVVGPLLGERPCATGRFLAVHQAIWLQYCSEDIATINDCFLLLMNLCSSVSSTMIYTYCNRYLLKPVSVTIYVLVTTTDNYLESLLTLTTLASSLECSTLTHINCLLLSLLLRLLSYCLCCDLSTVLSEYTYIHSYNTIHSNIIGACMREQPTVLSN